MLPGRHAVRHTLDCNRYLQCNLTGFGGPAMTKSESNPYSAGEQGLGYIYQPRFGLLRLLQLPENTSFLIEKDDDLDFVDQDGAKTLASLKHKAVGDHMTDLSTDFWKSVRVWLAAYNRDGRIESNLRFFLFTTSAVSGSSFLRYFVTGNTADVSLSELAEQALSTTESKLIQPIRDEFLKLNDEEKDDFLSRIIIFDNGPRIVDVPAIVIEQHMRTVRREFRVAVFERLEGWWNEIVINLLSGKRTEPIYGYEVSDKLSSLADEYKSDNLPISFLGKKPGSEIDTETDPRLFVVQLREIGISPRRIQSAILDYYRAFQQRSAWARENVLVAGEVEEYEDRLVDEWERYKDVVFEHLNEHSTDATLLDAGKALYKWAEFETSHIKIRERVSEPYVIRGGFHILANPRPMPRIYWHPRFLQRVGEMLGASQ